MIVTKLKQVVEQGKNVENVLYLRSLLKETIQDYILNFVYNSQIYKKLIFTGGTCLRKIYSLPRLSEDLDFDFIENFNISTFSQKIKDYFSKNLQYKTLETKISGNKNTIFLKFPILKEVGLVKNPSDSTLLFVRCDFSQEVIGIFGQEINPISSDEYTIFALSYDLPTLFSNKIIAILKRRFYKGKTQKISFKGRDIFDLVWFLEKSKKNNWQLQPNWNRVFKQLKVIDKETVVKMLVDKTETLDKKDVYTDLLPFIESYSILKNFSENFDKIIKSNIEKLISI